jgi:1-pyrroline-5-carboxylate dehydrogenase
MIMALMVNALPKIPKPDNSPMVSFAKGTKERELLLAEIERIRSIVGVPTLPLWINGPVYSKETLPCIVPHDFRRYLANFSTATEEHAHTAVETVLNARERWSQIPWFMRFHIFRKTARLLETKYLIKMVAAVMEDYSKNPYEAFIDVQELIDFLNFNVYYASQIYAEQPDSNQDTQNLLDYLPLEGFVFAASPNNFIAINGNLCTAPLIMGNVVIAKPSSDVVYSFHLFLNILHEAGLPADVLSVLHGNSKMIGDILLEHPMLSGIHFTGGTETFSEMWRRVGQNVDKYRNFPVLVGETGGKDPIVVYDDSDPLQSATAIAVGGFGGQGRKCSATSRVYMTPEMFAKVQPHLLTFLQTIKIGDVADFTNYMGAIINRREYEKVNNYIIQACRDTDLGVKRILRGRIVSSTRGWFIAPTIIVTDNPHYRTMSEEIFGPVITICLLPKDRFEREVLELCDSTSPYALTGAIHTKDVLQLCEALHALRFSAGNISDDRTTAAMVNQQPFSGLRKSGTDSKVGWSSNLRNWTKPRTICLRSVKTTFPPKYLEE